MKNINQLILKSDIQILVNSMYTYIFKNASCARKTEKLSSLMHFLENNKEQQFPKFTILSM